MSSIDEPATKKPAAGCRTVPRFLFSAGAPSYGLKAPGATRSPPAPLARAEPCTAAAAAADASSSSSRHRRRCCRIAAIAEHAMGPNFAKMQTRLRVSESDLFTGTIHGNTDCYLQFCAPRLPHGAVSGRVSGSAAARVRPACAGLSLGRKLQQVQNTSGFMIIYDKLGMTI
jgi:hypothetical protein